MRCGVVEILLLSRLCGVQKPTDGLSNRPVERIMCRPCSFVRNRIQHVYQGSVVRQRKVQKKKAKNQQPQEESNSGAREETSSVRRIVETASDRCCETCFRPLSQDTCDCLKEGWLGRYVLVVVKVCGPELDFGSL